VRVLDTRHLLAEHAVTPDGVVHDALIVIDGDRIASCESPESPGVGKGDGGVERVEGWVVPGFVDTHVHGGGGSDYATEKPDEAVAAREFHAAHGTTTSFASLVTAPVDVLCRQLATLADLVDDGHFAGVHLEGPFLSERQRGAHNPELLRAPDPNSVAQLIEAGRGRLAMVTLAPELPGAVDAITQLVSAGVRVAVGHTAADERALAAALEAGANVATHLFNAMPAIHHRRPGPVPRLLTEARVGIELIGDGFHVHPDVLRMAVAAAGPDRVTLVTDAMAAAGMPGGDYTLGGLDVRVRDGRARLVGPNGTAGSIAGSTLTMAGAFELMTGIVDDIATVAAMASSNAARSFGLPEVGTIAPGRRADLCVVDGAGALQRVMRGGRWLSRPDS
jgi:N-acetylglucosamine-6-phosphate deacetylase